MFTVLVTGSRTWTDEHAVWTVLNELLVTHKQLRVRHGDCPSGADAHARAWCEAIHDAGPNGFEITEQRRPALWDVEGRAAGPKRNERMLVEYPFPDLVTAFPLLCQKPACRYMADGPHWTHGTKHMIEIAEVAGVRVRTFKPDDLHRA